MISLRKHNRNLDFCHSLMYTNCYIATQFTQFSTTSNSHKMSCTRHFITFSVFGVSISLKCSFVQAQSQFRLLTLTSYYISKGCSGKIHKISAASFLCIKINWSVIVYLTPLLRKNISKRSIASTLKN